MFRNYCIRLSEKLVRTVLSQNQFLIKSNYEITKRWAGHSKWANIKHTKMLKDQSKSETFSKICKKVVLAVKESGEDPKFNYKLKVLMEEARRCSLPNETLKNAIKSAKLSTAVKPYWITYSGAGGLLVVFEVTLPKLALAVTTLGQYTKKINLKLLKYPGDLWHERAFIISEPLKDVKNGYEKALEDAIEMGIEEVMEEDDKTLVFECIPNRLDATHKKLADLGYNIQSASTEIEFQEYVTISQQDIETLNSIFEKMQSQIEDLIRISMNVKISQ